MEHEEKLIFTGYFDEQDSQRTSFDTILRHESKLILTGLGSLKGWMAMGIGALVGIVAPRGAVRYYRKRRVMRFNKQLVDSLIAMSNAFRAGLNLPQAMEYIAREAPAPLSQEFGLCVSEIKLGVSIDEALRNMAERAGIEKYVSLPGAVFQEEVRELLKEADIFTLPCIVAEDGDIDSIPVSLMEAMAMEIPVISTTVSGIPELVDDGVNGFLVPEKNAAALADALKRLIRDKKFRIELGRNARLKILDEFDLEKNALRLATLLREMF